jgi:hypothetical protein
MRAHGRNDTGYFLTRPQQHELRGIHAVWSGTGALTHHGGAHSPRRRSLTTAALTHHGGGQTASRILRAEREGQTPSAAAPLPHHPPTPPRPCRQPRPHRPGQAPHTPQPSRQHPPAQTRTPAERQPSASQGRQPCANRAQPPKFTANLFSQPVTAPPITVSCQPPEQARSVSRVFRVRCHIVTC